MSVLLKVFLFGVATALTHEATRRNIPKTHATHGDDDSFVQTRAKSTWSRKQELEDHYFNTVEGEDDSGETYDDPNDISYDDAFVQVAIQAHHEFDLLTAARAAQHAKSSFIQLHGKRRAPDDDEYDFAEDDSDDPSDFSVDQFLDNDVEESDAFVQFKAKKGDAPDDDYSDERLGGGEDVMTEADEENASDDEDQASTNENARRFGFLQRKNVQNQKPFDPTLLGVSNANVDNDGGNYKESEWMPYDADDDEGHSLLQVRDNNDDDYADDRLDGGIPPMLSAATLPEDDDDDDSE
eukprot:GEMP01063970.1.p1 GENE.GEMP01063970.1~~GEMP01063970.1.p1  ORF type:complete len:296 (+),score=88.34 GEMP01063970.1:134-1021(+)